MLASGQRCGTRTSSTTRLPTPWNASKIPRISPRNCEADWFHEILQQGTRRAQGVLVLHLPHQARTLGAPSQFEQVVGCPCRPSWCDQIPTPAENHLYPYLEHTCSHRHSHDSGKLLVIERVKSQNRSGHEYHPLGRSKKV